MDLQKIKKLIQTDIITMNGTKGAAKWTMILGVGLFTVLGMFGSPLAGVEAPVLIAFVLPSLLFHNAAKYNSERMHCVLPVSRRELVQARFIMTVGAYLIMGIGFYLLMLLSLKLELYKYVDLLCMGPIDTVEVTKKLMGVEKTDMGYYNSMYFAFFAVGIYLIGFELRRLFADPESVLGTIRLDNKKKRNIWRDFAPVIVLLVCIALWVLYIRGCLPIDSFIAVASQLLMQLSNAADGAVEGLVLIAVASLSCIYKYVCTVIEYDRKEL
ncbi:MAG: ABC-2 transporter permease [Oscillospiraceae bacterium]|nr:ABC-2 transporter permease [Oscillospiraceae bacterium]